MIICVFIGVVFIFCYAIEMSKQEMVTRGTVHTVSSDVHVLLSSNKEMLEIWNTIITPLGRNEWLCWIQSAKKDETRSRRIRIMSENIVAGKRRPCCWEGCSHR